MNFKKRRNNVKARFARWRHSKELKRLESDPPDYPIADTEGIVYAVSITRFQFKPETKHYYLLASNRCDSHYFYDENGYREKVGFARGLREIAKDWPALLGDRNI